ncbi:hypothetical protein H4R35_001078 [Dimargaris xerosporica]|nr:hypothetical protein H4R35_001078 [Dimargaris xerosporica]
MSREYPTSGPRSNLAPDERLGNNERGTNPLRGGNSGAMPQQRLPLQGNSNSMASSDASRPPLEGNTDAQRSSVAPRVPLAGDDDVRAHPDATRKAPLSGVPTARRPQFDESATNRDRPEGVGSGGVSARPNLGTGVAGVGTGAAAPGMGQTTNPSSTHKSSTPGSTDPDRARFERLARDTVPDSSKPLDQMTDAERALAMRHGSKGVASNVAGGRLPSTQQMAEGLDRVHIDEAQYGNLSREGQKLARDVENLAGSTQQVLLEKNQDEQLQKTMYHGVQAGQQAPGRDRLRQAGQSAKAYRQGDHTTPQLAKDLRSRVMEVSRLLVTSSAFRKLMGDFTNLFRDVVLDRSTQGTGAAQQQRTAGAESGTATRGGEPAASALNAPTGHQLHRNDQEMTGTQALDNMHQTVRDAQQPAVRSAMDGARPYTDEVYEGRMGVSDATRQMTSHGTNRMRDQLRQVHLSEQDKRQFTQRFRELMHEVQGNPRYQEAIEDLIDLLGALRSHAARTSRELTDKARTKAEQSEHQDLDLAVRNAQELVENFANGYPTDRLYDAFQNLFQCLREDQRSDALLHDSKKFVLASLRDPEFVDSDRFRPEANRLMDFASQVFNQHSRNASETIGREWQVLNRGFEEDTTTQQWSGDVRQVMHDLFYDESGKMTVKTELIQDAVKVLPQLVQAARFLPLPRMEYADEEYEYAVDNVLVSLSHILPNNICLATETNVDFGEYGQSLTDTMDTKAQQARARAHAKTGTHRGEHDTALSSSLSSTSSASSHGGTGLFGRRRSSSSGSGGMVHEVAFDVRNVVCTIHNAVFFYRKKKGFPRMSDSGLADITMNENKGMDLRLVVRVGDQTAKERSLRVVRVKSRVRSLSLKLRDTKHNVLYKLFSPILNTMIRKRMQHEIDDGIRHFIENMDEQMTQQAKQSAQSMRESRERRRQSHRDHHRHGEKGTAVGGATSAAGAGIGAQQRSEAEGVRHEPMAPARTAAGGIHAPVGGIAAQPSTTTDSPSSSGIRSHQDSSRLNDESSTTSPSSSGLADDMSSSCSSCTSSISTGLSPAGPRESHTLKQHPHRELGLAMEKGDDTNPSPGFGESTTSGDRAFDSTTGGNSSMPLDEAMRRPQHQPDFGNKVPSTGSDRQRPHQSDEKVRTGLYYDPTHQQSNVRGRPSF